MASLDSVANSFDVQTTPANRGRTRSVSSGFDRQLSEGAVRRSHRVSYKSTPPRGNELKALMGEVRNEHDMLIFASVRFLEAANELYVVVQTTTESDNDPRIARLTAERNGWIEVFLVHLRSLTHFYISESRQDDVVARHYARGWKRADGGADLEWLLAMSRSTNKRIGHITAYRQRVPKADDARLMLDVHEHLTPVVNAWRRQLTDEQIKWFDDPEPWSRGGPPGLAEAVEGRSYPR